MVCLSTLITKNCFTCFHLFLTSLDFNKVVEGLGAGQQDCGKLGLRCIKTLILNIVFVLISCLANFYKKLTDCK